MTGPECSRSLRMCSHYVRRARNHRPLLTLAANEMSSGRNAGVAQGSAQFLGAFEVESPAPEASDLPRVHVEPLSQGSVPVGGEILRQESERLEGPRIPPMMEHPSTSVTS